VPAGGGCHDPALEITEVRHARRHGVTDLVALDGAPDAVCLAAQAGPRLATAVLARPSTAAPALAAMARTGGDLDPASTVSHAPAAVVTA
jgi:hypothetical protein